MKSLKNTLQESLRIGIDDIPEFDFSDVKELYVLRFLDANAASHYPIFQIDVLTVTSMEFKEKENYYMFDGSSIGNVKANYYSVPGAIGKSQEYLYYNSDSYKVFTIFIHPELRDNFKNFVKELENIIRTPLNQRNEMYTADEIFDMLGISCTEMNNFGWCSKVKQFKMNVNGDVIINIQKYLRNNK